MTQDEKCAFVYELVNNTRDRLLEGINSGKVPDNWEHMELRHLVADRFAQVVLNGLTGKRLKDYKKDVQENELL